MNRVFLATAISAAFAAAAPFASAETDAGSDASITVAQAAPQRGPDAAGAQRQAPRRAFRLPSERVEARLAYARTALKITDAQRPQWDSFANVLRNQARAMDQRFQQRRAQWEAGRGAQGDQRGERPRVNAIERLERTQQRMTERSARLNELIAAAKPLYAVLSPEQKQIADGMLERGGHGGQRHRGMHRGPAA